jgi:preprotein translocase subunit SecG
MKTVLLVLHTLFAIALIALILLQSSKGGLGSSFGGGEFYRTKRGAERVVFLLTFIVAALFLVTSISNMFAR